MDPSLSTQDLRSRSQDRKRDTDNRRKWENGEESSKGRGPANIRPAKNQYASRRPWKAEKQTEIHHSKNNLKRATRLDTAEVTDSSADEALDITPFNEDDVDVAYSFDAEKGPGHGSQVLGYALAQAVEKFESATTDKIVKDEYLVLDSEGEQLVLGKHAKKIKPIKETSSIVLDEDEDYELV